MPGRGGLAWRAPLKTAPERGCVPLRAGSAAAAFQDRPAGYANEPLFNMLRLVLCTQPAPAWLRVERLLGEHGIPCDSTAACRVR